MAEETWTRRELPILERAAEAEATGRLDHDLGYGDLAAMLDIDEREAMLALGALVDAGYLDAPAQASAMGGHRFIRVRGLTEKGRRAVGQWPSGDPLTGLLALLDVRIEETIEPAERSKLIAFRDAALGIGQGIATSILTELIRRQAGL